MRERPAQLRRGDVHVGHEHLLNVHAVFAGLGHAPGQLVGRHHAIHHQPGVFRHRRPRHRLGRQHAVANGGRQRLAQLGHALLGQRRKSTAIARVHHLQHAHQVGPTQDGGHQHLVGAVARAAVHFFQKTQSWVDLPQGGLVVHVGNVEGFVRQGHIAGNALGRDGQLQVFGGVEPGFHAGNDGCFVVVQHIQGQAVGVEQAANVLAHLDHQLVQVVGVVDAGGDHLQIAEKPGLGVHARTGCVHSTHLWSD